MQVKQFNKNSLDAYAQNKKLQASCTHWLSGHGFQPPQATFMELAEYSAAYSIDEDSYGQGVFLQSFEKQIADLLGYPAGVFMPSGTMAQQITLRIAADRSKTSHVGFHHTSHLEVNEHHAYSHLHNLRATLLGEKNRMITAEDLEKITEPLAAIIIELPYRRLGGCLPTWDELEKIKKVAKEKNIHLHLDGARLWEAQPFYKKSLAEICAGFDSTYVSFYKGIGAFAGSMLLGNEDFIAESRIWMRRHGGNLIELMPYVVSAKMNFDRRCEKFPAYFERANSLARALRDNCPQVTIKPALPHTNMMHLFLNKNVPDLIAARNKIAVESKIWLGGSFFDTEIPGLSLMEVAIGDAALHLNDNAAVKAFLELLK